MPPADDPDDPDPSTEGTPLREEPPRDLGSASDDPVEPTTIAMPLPLALLVKIEHARHRFSHMVHDGNADPRLAAAAFYAERIAVQLLAEFVDPIADVEWAGDVMIIRFKIPNDADWDARLAVGPLGTAQYRITVGGQSTEVSCDQGWMIIGDGRFCLHASRAPTCEAARRCDQCGPSCSRGFTARTR